MIYEEGTPTYVMTLAKTIKTFALNFYRKYVIDV